MNSPCFENGGLASDRTREINENMYKRNIPSQPLQPYLNARPVMTKYSRLPIVDPRKLPTVPMEQLPIYNTSQVFNPGNNTATWSGYASNINVESDLKGQIFALQKCTQSVYVPNSNSDLYQYGFQPSPEFQKEIPYTDLYTSYQFEQFNPNPENIGVKNKFFNATRQQLKDYQDLHPGDDSCYANKESQMESAKVGIHVIQKTDYTSSRPDNR
jgi:hypothetical protein